VKIPKTLEDIDLSSEKYCKTKDKRQFLLSHKKDMIIYASKYQLEILSASQRWHIDGTFDASPKQF